MKKEIGLIFLGGLILSGCSSKHPLEGIREDISLQETELESKTPLDKSPVVIDNSEANKGFVQPLYNASHYYAPLSLSLNFNLLWSAKLDFESTKSIQMTASPVVAENKVFCLDAGGILYAFDKNNGSLLWRQSTTLKNKDGQIGEALAYCDGKVIVSSSFAETLAFDSKTGKILWRTKLPSPCKGDGITIDNGKAYMLCDNSTLQVLDIKTGKILWSHSGMNVGTTFAGSSGVAIKDDVIYLTYPSGEVYALFGNGSVLWTTMISKFSFVDASKSFAHPRACPIIKDNLVYVQGANQQLIAYDIKNGNIVWKYNAGGLLSPIVSGNSIFICNINSEIVCLNKDTGEKKWSKFISLDTGHWEGFLLTSAGLILVTDSGNLLCISEKDGTTRKVMHLDISEQGCAVAPVVADKVLYLPLKNGQLLAYK